MPSTDLRTRSFAKIALAAVLLAGLALLAGSQLAPDLAAHWVLAYSGLAAALLFVAVVAALIVSLTFRQFILRRGGTDTQWLWFPAEPQGLERLRAERREADEANKRPPDRRTPPRD